MKLYYETELYHYGVKGMKWGVRRAEKKAAHKKKLENIVSKNKNDHGSDLKYIKEANRSLGSRIASNTTKYITNQLLFDIFTGEIGKYSTMDKKQLTKTLTKKAASIAAKSTVDIAIRNAQAKSAAKKFDDNGKRVEGKKDRILTKENMIEKSVNLAVAASPIISGVLKWKMADAVRKRQANEARFKSWGANILPEKTKTMGNTIWISDDGQYSIIDKK